MTSFSRAIFLGNQRNFDDQNHTNNNNSLSLSSHTIMPKKGSGKKKAGKSAGSSRSKSARSAKSAKSAKGEPEERPGLLFVYDV